MKLMKLMKNQKLMFFLVIGVLIYVVYTNNLLALLIPTNSNEKEINITVENFKPSPVKYETKEAKFYKAQLDKIQNKNSKEHKAGALYLKHAVSDVFDLEKTPEDLARWKKYVKSKHGGLPKMNKDSGENFKDSCYPTLKYDGIHRV